MSELRIGFIGLGNMGGRMTKAITKTGRAVLGFDVVTDNIAASDAKPAASVAEVTDGSDIVLLSLPESKIVEQVVLGDDGVLAHVRDGQIVVDLSTASPESTRSIAAKISCINGASYLDAGISGGAAAADKAALTLMVGGDEATLERARPVLDFFSAEIYYMGESETAMSPVLNNFQRDQPDHHRRGDGGRQEGGPGPGEAARRDQPQLGRELRVAEPFSEDRHRRLPRRRPDLGPDAQGRAALHRVRRIARRRKPQSSAPIAAFGLAARLGYAQISNRSWTRSATSPVACACAIPKQTPTTRRSRRSDRINGRSGSPSENRAGTTFTGDVPSRCCPPATAPPSTPSCSPRAPYLLALARARPAVAGAHRPAWCARGRRPRRGRARRHRLGARR